MTRYALDDQLGQYTAGTPRVALDGQVATDGSGLEAERDQERAAANDYQPVDCDCAPDAGPSEPVVCWECWQSGHDSPNPAATGQRAEEDA